MYGEKYKSAEDVAHAIKGALEDAAFETASTEAEEFLEDGHAFSEEATKKLRKARRDGVTDLSGWYADELINDAAFIRDLAGDRIHWTHSANPDISKHDVWEYIQKNFSGAWVVAATAWLGRNPRTSKLEEGLE